MITKKYAISETYKNSPLVEVVCEIRFPADLAIECKRDAFYKKIKDLYPAILLPQVGHKSISSITPYRFENKDKNAGIMLGIERFSYYEKDYSGHKQFIKEFLRLTKVLKETYSLNALKRLGWRYINVIPFTREEGLVPLHHFTSAGVKVPEGISDKFENLSMVFVSKVSEGSITTRLEAIIQPENQQEALLMDFDFAMTDNLSLTKINTLVSHAHEQTKNLFENLITAEYREYLRGETI